MAFDAAKVAEQAERAAGKGLKAAAIFLAARVRETLSAPAPRTRVLGKRGKMAGVLYYRASSPATPGAPPRKLSGLLRRSIAYDVSPDGKSARVGTNVVYAARHELGNHPFLIPTVVRWQNELFRIIGQASQSP